MFQLSTNTNLRSPLIITACDNWHSRSSSSTLTSSDQNVNAGYGNIADFKKKNFSRNNFNSPKLIQKYNDLAREALSNCDKILYENYMQHAEHFLRINNSSKKTD